MVFGVGFHKEKHILYRGENRKDIKLCKNINRDKSFITEFVEFLFFLFFKLQNGNDR